jgi:hypothetical protein
MEEISRRRSERPEGAAAAGAKTFLRVFRAALS